MEKLRYIWTKQNTTLLVLLITLIVSSCRQKDTIVIRDDFNQYYNEYHVVGSFLFYDQANAKYTCYNRDQLSRKFTPASTFKIFNSLIGLETGVIPDVNFVLPWDGVTRPNLAWNKDQDIQHAFRSSTVWYYQELARRVGGQRMKTWLDKAGYGNTDTAGGIDKFWLSGGLRITPEQQLTFLRSLHDGKLPFSKRSMDKVKDMMIVKDTLGFVMRAKTGWGIQDYTEIGWYVGYLEKDSNVYYFVNCIQAPEFTSEEAAARFSSARKEIIFRLLKELGLFKG